MSRRRTTGRSSAQAWAPRARAAALAFGGCLLGAALSGCGFTPLYATPGMTPALASVEIVTQQSREGYLVKRQLNEELARDPDTPALYRLTLKLNEGRIPRGTRVNNVASRYELGLIVNYTLSDSATGKVLLTGAAPVEVSYDSADPPYAGVQANQDGEVRAADQAAIRIRLDLARYFERQAYPQPDSAKASVDIDPTTHQVAAPPVNPNVFGPPPLIGGAAGNTP